MIHLQKTKLDTSHEPASEFLERTLAALDSSGLCYCVARNYELYPGVITGDVDLIMAASDMKSAERTILRVADNLDWRPFVKYLSSRSVHLGFYSDIYPRRFVLVFELFAGGAWRGQQFLSAERIIEMRHRYRCTWKPHATHEAMITLVHHLLYNGCVFEKYRKQIRKCVESAPIFFEEELCKAFGKKRAKNISECVKNNKWNELENISPQIRRFFLLRSLCLQPLRFIHRVVDLFAEVRSKPEGVVIAVEATSPEEMKQVADTIIELADRWHIFIPPTREKIAFFDNDKSIARSVQSIVASGGVAVILNEESRRLPDFTLQYPIVHVNVQGDLACISIGDQSISCPVIRKTLAFDIWNVILKCRSNALVRG